MNKRLIVLALPLLLAACNGQNPSSQEEGTRVITDMIGREVTLNKATPKRVVCIGAGALRLYSYIADTSLLCGVEDIDNETLENRPKMFDGVARPYVTKYKDVFAKLPSCGVGGPNAQSPEEEKILACRPDIVISQYTDVQSENALQEKLGIPVVTVRTGSADALGTETKDSLKLLGEIFGQKEKADSLVSYIESEQKTIYDRTLPVADNENKAYICGLGNWGTTNHLMTAQNFQPFQNAHIPNVVSGLATGGIQAIEKEKFVEWSKDMDMMVFDAAAIKNIKPLYKEDNTMFDTCKAFQTGEVYLQMAYNAYFSNIELVLANSWFVAKSFYPSLFEDIDMATKTNEITTRFLGEGLYSKIKEYPHSFGGYQKIDVKTFFN